MRLGWRRAGTSLVLAGVLGASVCWSSEPITIDPATGLPVFQPGQPVPPMVVVEAAKARDWIMQIELALLADPVTFPYVIRAQAGQDGMELRGFVPNHAIRDKALGMARQICPISVLAHGKARPDFPAKPMSATRLKRDAETSFTVNKAGDVGVDIHGREQGRRVMGRASHPGVLNP